MDFWRILQMVYYWLFSQIGVDKAYGKDIANTSHKPQASYSHNKDFRDKC